MSSWFTWRGAQRWTSASRSWDDDTQAGSDRQQYYTGTPAHAKEQHFPHTHRRLAAAAAASDDDEDDWGTWTGNAASSSSTAETKGLPPKQEPLALASCTSRDGRREQSPRWTWIRRKKDPRGRGACTSQHLGDADLEYGDVPSWSIVSFLVDADLSKAKDRRRRQAALQEKVKTDFDCTVVWCKERHVEDGMPFPYYYRVTVRGEQCLIAMEYVIDVLCDEWGDVVRREAIWRLPAPDKAVQQGIDGSLTEIRSTSKVRLTPNDSVRLHEAPRVRYLRWRGKHDEAHEAGRMAL